MENDFKPVGNKTLQKQDDSSVQNSNDDKKNKLYYSFGAAIVATLLMLSDFLISSMFFRGSSFTWIAFINWTLFATSPKIERFKALVGYIVGYFAANVMIFASSRFQILAGNPSILPVGSLAVGFLFNLLIARYGCSRYSRTIFNSIPATFLGMSFAFSGLGIGMNPSNLSSLAIIITYGTMGLLCCFGCDFFAKRFLRSK